MDLAIIFISLLLLMFFAYRGFSLIFIAPIFAVLAAITSDYTSMPVYSELYMTKAAEYIKSYYPVFLLGAVFAKIMEEGGLAASVAAAFDCAARLVSEASATGAGVVGFVAFTSSAATPW